MPGNIVQKILHLPQNGIQKGSDMLIRRENKSVLEIYAEIGAHPVTLILSRRGGAGNGRGGGGGVGVCVCIGTEAQNGGNEGGTRR